MGGGGGFGLTGFSIRNRSPSGVIGFFALGMSFACVYTRYHHAVDVPAEFLAGFLGALFAYRVTSEPPAGA